MMHHHTLKLFACNWSQLKLIARIFLIALLHIKLIVNLLPELVTGVLHIRTPNGNRCAPCPMLSSVKYTHFVKVSSKQKHIFLSDLTYSVVSRALQSNNPLLPAIIVVLHAVTHAFRRGAEIRSACSTDVVHCLILDNETIEWLLNTCLEI